MLRRRPVCIRASGARPAAAFEERRCSGDRVGPSSSGSLKSDKGIIMEPCSRTFDRHLDMNFDFLLDLWKIKALFGEWRYCIGRSLGSQHCHNFIAS